MSASVMEAIETSVTSAVASVPGITSSIAIPAGQMCDQRALRETGDFVPQTRPESYPGAVISLVEQDTKQTSTLNGPSSSYTRFATAVYIVVYATSPSGGSVPNDARYKAWELGEAVVKTLMIVVPSGLPAGTQMMIPLQFEQFMEINVDATTHGLMIVFNAEYQIGVSQ